MSELNQFEAARRDRIARKAQNALSGFNEEIALILDAETAVILISQLQLALRHPGNVGITAQISREIVALLIGRLPEEARELLELGFDPRYDS